MKRKVVVRLLNPEMCLKCRFAGWGVVEREGVQEEMIFCRRLDCDNWETTGAKPVERFEEER